MIRAVHKDFVPAVWPAVAGYIESACEYSGGSLTGADVYAALLDGRMQLYVCGEDLRGAFTTEISQYSAKKVVRGVCIGGDPGACDFGEITGMLRAWAREIGAAKVELIGRKGWVRALKDHGWRQASVIMEVDADE